MKNLKRYDFIPCSCVYETSEMSENKKGVYVKFSDIKDILKPSHNTQSEPCANCGHDKGDFMTERMCPACLESGI